MQNMIWHSSSKATAVIKIRQKPQGASLLADVTHADMLFLIGLPAMRKWGAALSAVAQQAQLAFLSRALQGLIQSDRLSLPLSDAAQAPKISSASFTAVEAKRLHHHFKHASADGMARALKNAGRAVTKADRQLFPLVSMEARSASRAASLHGSATTSNDI